MRAVFTHHLGEVKGIFLLDKTAVRSYSFFWLLGTY